MASPDGYACMDHATSVLYVSRSLSDRRAMHSSMCSNGCLQNISPGRQAIHVFEHAATQLCPVLSLPTGVGVLLVGRELVARIQWFPRQSWRVMSKATVGSSPQCAQQDTGGLVVCGAGPTIYP